MTSKTCPVKVFILVLAVSLLTPHTLVIAGPNPPPPIGDAPLSHRDGPMIEMQPEPYFTSVRDLVNRTTSVADSVVTPLRISATLNPGQTHNAQIDVFVGDAPVGKGDVMFIIDRTGSMGGVIDEVKTSAVQIMNEIRSKLPFAWFGVGSFMDYPDSYTYPGYSATYGSAAYGDVPWELNISPTDNITDVAATIGELWLGYGADGPECYTRALHETSQIEPVGWRMGAKRIVVLFGDAPTHDLTYAGYNFGGDPGFDAIALTEDDLVFVDTVQQVADKGISIVAVDSGYSAESEATFKGMSIGYAESPGTNGRYFQLQDTSQVPTEVTQLIISETQQIDLLWLQVTEGYESWVETVPEEYPDVMAPITKTFDVEITVPNGTSPGFYPFLIQALGDGAILGRTYVEVTVPASSQISDLGFRPDPDGFRFPNEASRQTWEMFRQFFGVEQVEWPNGDRIHAAVDFYENHYQNAGGGWTPETTDDGSCDGFSATSLLNNMGLSQPNAGIFAMPHYASLYSQANNSDITEAFAFSQGIQMGMEIHVHSQLMCQSIFERSPWAFYQYLKSQIQNDSPVVLGIRWNREYSRWPYAPLMPGGHALVPYRFEEPSSDTAYVYVYDSNLPGNDEHRVEFDKVNDEWTYRWPVPLRPDVIIEGDATYCSLRVTPIEIYRHQGVAWWAQAGWEVISSSETQADPPQLLTTSGPARLLLIDDQGRRLGWEGADFYDEIPGAGYTPIAMSTSAGESGFYYVPSEVQYTLTAHGYSVGQSDIGVFSEGYMVQLSNWDVITGTTVAIGAAPDGSAFAIRGTVGDTKGSLTISQILSAEDRTITIKDLDIRSGETVNLQFETSDTVDFTDTIRISTNSMVSATYDLSLRRAGGEGYSSFGHPGLILDAGSIASVEINDWSNLDPVTIDVDLNGDGYTDETRLLTNEASISEISLEPSRDTVYTGGGQVNLIVEVRDQFGAYVADGQTLTFSTNLGNLSSEAGSTKGGLFYLTLTTGSEAGIALITAQSEGVEGTATITIVSYKTYLPLIIR